MSLQNWLEKYIPAADSPRISDEISRAAEAIANCEALFIGAGAGLSASAGFEYSGERFGRYFADFEKRFGFHDMYSGSFYNFDTLEEQWAFASRQVWLNRYTNPPKSVYRDLLKIAKGKNYFVLTSNVDHCFQKAKFDKSRLFYIQGDYGLFQCSVPCHMQTYDNEDTIRRMVTAQGYSIGEGNALTPPADGKVRLRVPSSLIPRCPKCGKPMRLNLRSDDTFVQDSGWDAAAARYDAFCSAHETGRVVYLELGVGYNTPGIIKYPFMQRTFKNPQALYVCVNSERQRIPEEIAERSLMIESDIGKAIKQLLIGA